MLPTADPQKESSEVWMGISPLIGYLGQKDERLKWEKGYGNLTSMSRFSKCCSTEFAARDSLLPHRTQSHRYPWCENYWNYENFTCLQTICT